MQEPQTPSLGSPALSQGPGLALQGAMFSATLLWPLNPSQVTAEKLPWSPCPLPPGGNCIYQEKRSLASKVHLSPNLLSFLEASASPEGWERLPDISPSLALLEVLSCDLGDMQWRQRVEMKTLSPDQFLFPWDPSTTTAPRVLEIFERKTVGLLTLLERMGLEQTGHYESRLL